MNASKLWGFRKYAVAPSSSIAFISPAESEDVTTTTGAAQQRCDWRSAASTEVPGTFGKLRSSRTRPGWHGLKPDSTAANSCIAASPSVRSVNSYGKRQALRASPITKASVALSSTSQTFTGAALAILPLVSSLVAGVNGKTEAEGRSLSRSGPVEPNSTTVLFNNSFADRKADAAPGKFSAGV